MPGIELITGGSGFVGTALAQELANSGRTVRILDVAPPPQETRNLVEWHQGSVLDDVAVARAMCGVSVVYHAAALVPLTRAGRRFHDVNARGTAIVAEAALAGGVRRFVHISSSAVYDPRDSRMPITELTPESPVGRYGASKWDAEREVLARASAGLSAVIVRPRTVVDEGRGGIFQILFDWVSRGARIFVVGDGREQFQLIGAHDLARACMLSAEAAVDPGTVVNVGADEFATFGELIERLVAYAGTGSRIVHVPAGLTRIALRAADLLRLSPLTDWHYLTLGHSFFFDNGRAHDLLGWHPRDSNDALMRRAYDHYVSHADQMKGPGGSTHRAAARQGLLRRLRRR